MSEHSPDGDAGFPEFLATLPSEYFAGAPAPGREAELPPVEPIDENE